MLIEFSVANYRSFRERVTLSMEAEPRISERDKSVDERNVAHTSQGELLRVVGVYGANASGKSNLLRAMRTMRALVLDSAREGQAGDRLPVESFRLEPEMRSAPSELEIVFSDGGMQYRYGLAATEERVVREWLFVRAAEGPEQPWFEREGDVYTVGPDWQRDPSVEHKTRTEALHLSVAAAFNSAQAKQLLGWFRRLRFMDSSADPGWEETSRLLGDAKYARPIRELVRRLDFGIDELRVVEPDKKGSFTIKVGDVLPVMPWVSLTRARIVTKRNGVEFDLDRDESAGTGKAFALAGPLVVALAQGDVVLVDELDSHLHTLLAKQLVELFQDPLSNPHDAQLVFASHDTNLLTRTLMRRDQLWFVEKSRKTQASDLYSLAELRFDDGKGVRNDARYQADYLQGRYGAIPFFGNLGAVLGETLEEEQ